MNEIRVVNDIASICSIIAKDCTNENGCENCSVNYIYKNIEHLAKLHEQGRLIELPCKVGGLVYRTIYWKEITILIFHE